jgi:HD-GYP domain-containing protein (c-di-GMP phosphodiesterase class II)
MIAKLLSNHSQLPVSVSVGWAADYNTSSNMGSLCKEADHTMYRKKLHQSQSMRSAIVQTMMKALKARDYITEGHVERLQNLVENMGKKLGISDARLADLQLFAQFHDIGKVGISDQILNKEGKLTPEEFTVMKRHSDIGFRIALASPDLMPIAELILKHHEWWNGGGYPMGISGRKIPLECRILALADAYDAMTNDRPYRKALAPEVAICELRRCAGSQFDPHLVELFIELLDADLRSSIFSGKSLNHNLLSSGNALPAPKGKLSELYAINKM